jgi:hypothetical protein
MRALATIVLGLCMPLASAVAGDVDLSKIDYGKFAQAERKQLAKCFTDILAVAKRHSLREHLTGFLEAGCESEMRSYQNGLGREPPPGLETLSKDLQKQFFATHLIGDMELTVDDLYEEDDKQMPICSGEACVLDAYRSCLYLQISEVISKRAKPREFENAAQRKCEVQEGAARAKLIVDFVTVQKEQLDQELSQKTRDLIEQVISDIRHKIVFAYSEDLIKFQPERKSCKTEMCGDNPCLSLGGPSNAEVEYDCAISQ